MNISIIKNIISQPRCAFCDSVLDIRTSDYVCEKCKIDLPYVKGNTCDICGRPLYTGYMDTVCHDCKAEKIYFIKNISVCEYKDNVKEAILKMKFTYLQIWIARELGKILANSIKEQYGDIRFDMIVPVPISQINFTKRRFNQALEIALPISRAINIPVNDKVLKKIRHTKQQSSLGHKERKANVKGAYKVFHPDEICDKIILLIDDVYTTGSTINECAKTLKKAGAMSIYTATFAITTKE